MPKRLSYLLSLVSLASTPADRDIPQTIREFIADEIVTTGKPRSIIRRDLIHQNGYRGVGAQATFAADLAAALKGDPSELLSHLHEKDRDTVAAVLPTPTLKTPPLYPSLTTAIWLEQQCREKNLHVRLAASLKRDFRAEEYTECLSFAGLWIARWSASGSFDKFLAADGTVRFSVMMTFLKRKHYSAIFVRGAEPLHRLRGARTQHEIRMRVETGDEGFLCHDATQSTDWDTAWEGDSEEGCVEEVVISPSPTPEEELSGAEDAAFIRKAGASLVRAAHRGAADRYERVYDAIMEGATREEVAQAEGVSSLRAGHLTGKVRKSIREGEITVEIASKILHHVAREPWSTRQEIQNDLRVGAVEVRKALGFLLEQGLLQQAQGESFAVSPEAQALR